MQTLESSPDFRILLQQELVRRCQANPKYSLRAFARRLKLEPSFLSKLVNGKRSITPSLIRKIGPDLGLNPNQVAELCVAHRPARHTERGAAAEREKMKYHQLALDAFQVIADWYHYAILELIQVDDCQHDARWIAQALGISVSEAGFAIERLERLGMLVREESGKLVNRSGNNTTLGNEFTAAAFRKLQRQILEQAISALEEVPLERREQSSMTMAIDSSLLPEAKLRIRNFRRELSGFLESGTKKDHVYQLSLSLFPVTRERKK